MEGQSNYNDPIDMQFMALSLGGNAVNDVSHTPGDDPIPNQQGKKDFLEYLKFVQENLKKLLEHAERKFFLDPEAAKKKELHELRLESERFRNVVKNKYGDEFASKFFAAVEEQMTTKVDCSVEFSDASESRELEDHERSVQELKEACKKEVLKIQEHDKTIMELKARLDKQYLQLAEQEANSKKLDDIIMSLKAQSSRKLLKTPSSRTQRRGGREDGAGGRQPKGIERGLNDCGAKGAGGQGSSGPVGEVGRNRGGGRGRGREKRRGGREDGAGGRQPKGIERGLDDGGAKGAGGQGSSGPVGEPGRNRGGGRG